MIRKPRQYPSVHRTILFVLVSVFILVLLPTACYKQNPANTILVSEPWIREAPPNASMLAGYATIKNNSNQDYAFLSAKSSQFKMIELHETLFENGIAKMRQQNNFVISAGDALELKPGSYHLMLMHPQSALKLNDEVAITIALKKGSDVEEIDIMFPVRKAR